MASGGPRVVVLLASHDGAEFVDEQIASILGQRDVDVRIVVSDDMSTDGTWALLEAWAQREPDRVVLMPQQRRGSAPANFTHLILHADVADADAIAFSDQDDRWHDDKLVRQWSQLQHADAVSSDVVAVFASRRVAIRKSQPQRELDYVFESGGPGCTFLLRPDAFALVRDVLECDEEARRMPAHDWLVYAVVRAAGRTWRIESEATLDYRQHGGNVTGANVGPRSATMRLRQMRSGRFRQDCALIASVASRVAAEPQASELRALASTLERSTPARRVALLRRIGALRRRARDRAALASLLVLGVW